MGAQQHSKLKFGSCKNEQQHQELLCALRKGYVDPRRKGTEPQPVCDALRLPAEELSFWGALGAGLTPPEGGTELDVPGWFSRGGNHPAPPNTSDKAKLGGERGSGG